MRGFCFEGEEQVDWTTGLLLLAASVKGCAQQGFALQLRFRPVVLALTLHAAQRRGGSSAEWCDRRGNASTTRRGLRHVTPTGWASMDRLPQDAFLS